MEKVIITEKGFLYDKVPAEVYKELLANIDIHNVDSKKTYSSSLAGNMEKEFEVTNNIPNSFYEYIAYLANSYYDLFPREKVKNNKRFEFIDSWLNYQKKHEFNPIHLHDGSLSYVVWIKIPYDISNELKLPNNLNTKVARNSIFEFTVDDTSFGIFVNSSMEGQIIIFNSKYLHQVYPFFTSDEYRISLAGNLKTHWVD